jgi:hypothetical protein
MDEFDRRPNWPVLNSCSGLTSAIFALAKMALTKTLGVAVRIAVNKRKSTSLVAGVCTVCIATATGAAQPPVAPEHHESGVRVVSQEVALTASTGNRLADIAQLPFQNYFTIASTLGQLAAFVPPVNQAMGAFFQGNFAPIPGLLTKAFNDELAAINNVLQLPGEIISYDLSVIGRAIGGIHAPLNANMSSIERDALSATLAAFADKNAGVKKFDVIEGEVVDSNIVDVDVVDDNTGGDTVDADTTGADTPGASTPATGKKDADVTGKKFSDEIGKKYEEVTGKKFSDLIGKKDADTGKKDAEETGKKDTTATGKKDADTVGAIRHAISNATGKKKADKDSNADSAAK